jgi:hypothetical protein
VQQGVTVLAFNTDYQNATFGPRMTPLVSLIKKDLLMEWRQKHTLFGVLLYVGATVFVVYMMSGQPDAKIWNALFWLTQLFVSANSVAKSFLQEHHNRFRYYLRWLGLPHSWWQRWCIAWC